MVYRSINAVTCITPNADGNVNERTMTNSARATIDDVARAAGVSRQTVSNVLRDRGRVADATRARVREAIETLGYRPHTGAASLRSRRSGRIAHPVFPGELDPSNTIMLEFIRALTAAAGKRNHYLVLAADGTGGAEDLVHSGSADAVVLADIAPNDERVATLVRLGVPFACFGRIEPELSHNWIDVDSREGVRILTTRLIATGHTRIAFLGYQSKGPWDIGRENGFREAMAAAGLTAVVTTPPADAASIQRAIDELLNDAPTAIVTGSDVLAREIYVAAMYRRIRIGDDLAVTGFDGGTVGRSLTPSLTTLAIPLGYIAEWLVDRALAQIGGTTDDPGELVVPDLIVGDSAAISMPGA